MCTAPEFGFFGGTCGSPAPTDPGDWGEGGGRPQGAPKPNPQEVGKGNLPRSQAPHFSMTPNANPSPAFVLEPLDGETIIFQTGNEQNEAEFFECLDDDEIPSFEIAEIGLDDENVPKRVIAPTHVTPMQNSNNLGRVSNPILMHLLKNITVVKFDNREENWENWKWEFENMCEKVAQDKVLSEKTKATLLEMSLPENLLQEFKLLQRTQKMSFTPFMAKLEERFGRGQLLIARRKWEKVEINNWGNIKTQHFREFEVKFRDAWKDVHDATPDEAQRILMSKLPHFMRQWVLEKQEKNAAENPIVCLTAMPGLGEREILNTVKHLVGDTPTRAEIGNGGQYLIQFSTMSAAKKLLALHGRTVRGQTQKLSAKFKDQKMSVDEIFECVVEKLRIREMGEEYSKERVFPRQRGVWEMREERPNPTPPPKERRGRKKSPEKNQSPPVPHSAPTSSPRSRREGEEEGRWRDRPTTPPPSHGMGVTKVGGGGGVGPFHNWHPRGDGWIDVRSYPPNNWQKGNSPSWNHPNAPLPRGGVKGGKGDGGNGKNGKGLGNERNFSQNAQGKDAPWGGKANPQYGPKGGRHNSKGGQGNAHFGKGGGRGGHVNPTGNPPTNQPTRAPPTVV